MRPAAVPIQAPNGSIRSSTKPQDARLVDEEDLNTVYIPLKSLVIVKSGVCVKIDDWRWSCQQPLCKLPFSGGQRKFLEQRARDQAL